MLTSNFFHKLLIVILFAFMHPQLFAMPLVKRISGELSPKSVVHSGNGLFFAQNMMYRHTVTVYDRSFKLLKTIPDNIKLSDWGFKNYKGLYRGSPVEADFSNSGAYAWVSNYEMYGPEFKNPGNDRCTPKGNHDKSYLYQISTARLTIENVIEVGSVPKYVAVTADNKYVLVSNWCTWDVSIVDIAQKKEIRRVKLGRYPRGIAIDNAKNIAYIAVMGSYDIAILNLSNFSVSWIKNVGRSPRHLNLESNGKYLYATLNGEGMVAKIDLETQKVVTKISTGHAPRSMIITKDGSHLFVVNYKSNTMSKVRTSDMTVVDSVKTDPHPIGITYDEETKRVWVACYTGSIMVFQN